MEGINWNNNYGRQNGQLTPPVSMPALPMSQLPQLGVEYVKGRQGVIDFPTPPNCPGIPLFDSESSTLFIKSTDGYGNPSILEFDVTLRKTQAEIQNDAMAAMNARMDRLEEMLTNALSNKSGNGGATATESTAVQPEPTDKRRR